MRRTRTTARLIASVGLVATSLMGVGAGVGLTGTAAVAQDAERIDFDESFENPEFDQDGWRLLGDACLTGQSREDDPTGEPTDLPDGDEGSGCLVSDEDGPDLSDGYLRLTDAQTGQTGGVVNQGPLPSDEPLTFTFEQYQFGGDGGEGLTFFLADEGAEVTDTGAGGGSLGYSPELPPVDICQIIPDLCAARRADRTTRAAREDAAVEGIDDAYLGIGFDAKGNFSTQEADGTGCDSDDELYAGPNAVVLRGGAAPTEGGGSDNTSGYCLLASEGLDADQDLRGEDLEDAKRTVVVTVSPRAGLGPAVTVSVDFGDGPEEVLTQEVEQAPQGDYQFGFTGSTFEFPGIELRRSRAQQRALFGTDLHLIRNLSVTTPGDDPGPGPGPGPRPPTNPDPQPAPIPTTTDLTVTRNGMSATVSPPARVDPPTGEVVFSADGEKLDTVELEVVDGVATAVSDETVPPGEDVDFTAEYLGEGNYEPSEDLYERVDPTITARVITDEEPNAAGWYSDPLRIAFSCTRGSAPIIGGCPDRVYRKNTHPRKFFERSIAARDGGGDTVVVPIRVDHRGPVITVHRAKGSPYPRDARPIRCTAIDGRSGVKRECWVEYGEFETLSSGRVRRHFTVRSTDVAGNISVRRLTFWIERDR